MEQQRATTPLWPQANGEVELYITEAFWKQCEPLRPKIKIWLFLLAYRMTPHSTTGCTPAKLLFGRELKTKLPELVNIQTTNNQGACDRGSETKQRIKDYADQIQRR